MLDHFMEVSLGKTKKAEREAENLHLLSQLPREELYAIATGAIKVADLCSSEKAGGGDDWLVQFKGSPLLEQAVQLAQEEIALDMQDLQQREQRMADAPPPETTWIQKDQLRLKRRLLELQLAQQELGVTPGEGSDALSAAAPAPAGGAQGAGAPGPEVAPVLEGKQASVQEKIAFADAMGRELAQAEAHHVELDELGAAGGVALAKIAFDWAGAGQKALGVVKSHPMATLGAGLGAMKGLQKDQNGQRHLGNAVSGAVAGGLAGQGAQSLAPQLADKVTGAVGGAASAMAPHLQALGAKMRGALGQVPGA